MTARGANASNFVWDHLRARLGWNAVSGKELGSMLTKALMAKDKSGDRASGAPPVERDEFHSMQDDHVSHPWG
jgi:hypothetical protein